MNKKTTITKKMIFFPLVLVLALTFLSVTPGYAWDGNHGFHGGFHSGFQGEHWRPRHFERRHFNPRVYIWPNFWPNYGTYDPHYGNGYYPYSGPNAGFSLFFHIR